MMGRRSYEEQGRARFRTPAAEISETQETVILRAEMPGVEKEDFDIDIDGNTLTIRGKRKQNGPRMKVVHNESDQSDYCRTFSLGDSLDTSTVGANVDQGILTLTFPKKPEILPKKIEVQV